MPGLKFIKQVLANFGSDKASQLSAAFSYGAIFSIGPLLLVLVSVIGLIYGHQAAQGKLYSELASSVGSSSAHTIQNVISHRHRTSSGVVGLILGTLGVLLGAAGLTSQIQSSFDTILGITSDPKGGIKRKLYVKAKNVAIILLGGLLIALSLAASTVIVGFGKHLQSSLGISPFVLEVLNALLSLLIFVMILYLVYRVLPDAVIPHKIALTAALYVSFLFLVGKIILSIIIGRNGTASAYGAAASVISLLLWIYYGGQILFLGCEGIKTYAFNESRVYPPKKFNLKRNTVHVDSGSYSGRLVEAWIRGFRKSRK